MKVLLISDRRAFQTPGGAEIQLLKTKRYLKDYGVDCDIFSPKESSIGNYDLIHAFKTSPDHIPILEYAKEVGVPSVLSTIFWDQRAYNPNPVWHLQRRLKVIMRNFLSNANLNIFDIGYLYKLADVLAPNSRAEKQVLMNRELISQNQIEPIPNGVDKRFRDADPEKFVKNFGKKSFCLFVGRIDPRKNLLNLMKAFKDINEELVVVGPKMDQREGYYKKVQKEAPDNVLFTGPIDHDSALLESAYAAAETFVLPSFCETPGLAALEAGLAGCKIAITERGSTREYFTDYANYLDPENVDSIIDGITSPVKPGIDKHIEDNFTWGQVAEHTWELYQKSSHKC